MKVFPTLVGLAFIAVGLSVAIPSVLSGWLFVGLLVALSVLALALALRPESSHDVDL